MTEPLSFDINEEASGTYTATLVANDGVTPIPAAQVATLTLTLYVIKQDGTDQIVNGRNLQNVLNANNVTVDAVGQVVWTVQPADTAMVENIPFELHRALFHWTWADGEGYHEVHLRVRNLRRVP